MVRVCDACFESASFGRGRTGLGGAARTETGDTRLGDAVRRHAVLAWAAQHGDAEHAVLAWAAQHVNTQCSAPRPSTQPLQPRGRTRALSAGTTRGNCRELSDCSIAS
jgi:hypothetical protein